MQLTCNIILKIPAKVFSHEFYEIFQSSCFIKRQWTEASHLSVPR